MQMNEFLRLLKGVSGSSGQYKAKCPAHDDKDPSLGERDGKILLHCHRGCATESILSALGLGMKDLYSGSKTDPINTNPTKTRVTNNGKANGNGKGEITAVYDYKHICTQHQTLNHNG